MKVKNIHFNCAVGQFFSNLRRRNHLSGKNLATLLGICQQQISRYENGKTEFTINRIFQYLEIFNLTWDDFIFGVNVEHDKILKKSVHNTINY